MDAGRTDIKINNLSKKFGEKQVFDGFNMTIPGGQVLCLMGPSGCGKTTLINILAGLDTEYEGEIEGINRDRDVISIVFQENRLCENYSAFSNTYMVAEKGFSKEKTENVLKSLGLGADLHKPVRELSGGMKRRVAVARSIVFLQSREKENSILILDEPFTGLDPDTKTTVADYIKNTMQGATILIVTHDKDDADLFGGKIIDINTAISTHVK